MKIGEALNQRKHLMNHIPHLVSRLQGCITVVQGAPVNRAEPAAQELKAAIDMETEQLRDLIIRINRTNNETRLPCGLTIMQGIAHREYLKSTLNLYTQFASYIRPRVEKDYRDQERTTYVVAEGIHPAGVKQQISQFAAEWRKLDNELQQVNWTADLLD